jgi:hypothetical protein
MAINHIVGGRGSTGSASYSPVQLTIPHYPVALPPFYGISSPGVAGVGEAPATDATHRILNASTATLPTGWSEARSTTATYYNSSGVVSTASSNTLRNDYTSAGVLRGYEIEPAATNIALMSSTFNNVPPWHVDTGATLTSTTAADPSGGTTAGIVNYTTTGASLYQQQVAVTVGAVYTISVWVRKSTTSGSNWIRLNTNNSLAWGTGIGAKYALTSTWTRISLTGVALPAIGGAGAVANIGIDSREPTAGTYDTDIIGNVDVWGFQIELGSAMTSYIPTTTATVTRAADVASFTLDAAATDLALTYDDGSVTIYTGVPPGSTFNVPTQSSLRLLYIDDNVAAAGSVGAASGAGTATAEGTGIVTAVGSAAGSGTASGVVVGLSATDKNAAINVSADGLTASLSSTPGGDVEGRGNTAGVANSAFEVVFNSGAVSGFPGSGIANSTQGLSVYSGSPNAMAYYASGYYEGPGGITGSGATYTDSDAITWELLASSAKVYKNGTLQVTFTTLPSGSLYPIVSLRTSGDSATFNFGAKAFSYLPAGDTGWNGLTQLAGNVGAASGSGTAAAVGASTAASVGSAAGTGAATAVGASTARSPGSAAGSATVTAVGAATAASAGSSAGSATVTAVGAATARSIGAAAGSGAATAVGASTAASVGSSIGSGTATAVAIASAIGSAAGTGSATAVGVSTAAGVGSAAGTETVTAVGSATDASAGSSTGSSTASAVGVTSADGVGASAGSGTATAAGTTTVAGIGSSAGSSTAQAYSGILAQAAGSGAASAVGSSTASAIGASAGASTSTATGSSTSVSNSVGSSSGSGTASGVGTTVGVTTVVSAIGTAAGSSTSSGIASTADFGDDFGSDFANLLGAIPEQNDFGSDFSFDFAVLHEASFNDDFNDDFSVRHITQDFNEDFSSDFAIHHGIQRIVSGVGRAGGASIVSGAISGLKPGDIPTDGEPPPPVYPLPPPPVPLVWHPAHEYRRVQPPRAIRIHRHGTELRRSTPRSMKRRYG